MRVVIAGAGVAGIEAALALSALADDLVEVELLSPAEEFVYRPMLVAEPFGSAEVLKVSLAQVAVDTGARHRRESLASVNAVDCTVTTDSGHTIDYQALLVALGAVPVSAVPGALTFGQAEERGQFTQLLGRLGRAGVKRIAFVVPPASTWPIAAYELALLTAAEREARRLFGVELSVVTHEVEPLNLFGAAAAALVRSRLSEAGVTLRTSARAERFEDGRLTLASGEQIDLDAAVALPRLEVAPLPGLPQREQGFVQTDAAMHVIGLEQVWAAGDVTWFPVKQGGIAAQQADVAARAIAARAGAHVPMEPFQPALRGVLITGNAPEFLRRMRAEPTHASASALWSPATKLAGRYLGPYLARIAGIPTPPELVDLEAEEEPEATEGRKRATALILAAADADAGSGDFEGAIRWLSLVERLNLVIPPEYVARRHEWRRQLWPDTPHDEAAERIDPSFASAAVALSDLQRRIGWLREIEHRDGGEMGADLSRFDDDLHHLTLLSRRSGIL